MQKDSDHLIIQGNFKPARSSRLMRMSTRVLSLLLGLFLMAALSVYGIKVNYEQSINRVARETRELNEQNKELQVKLNHIRSYKNLEEAATQAPQLHLPETVIEAPSGKKYRFQAMPKPAQEFPRVYGY